MPSLSPGEHGKAHTTAASAQPLLLAATIAVAAAAAGAVAAAAAATPAAAGAVATLPAGTNVPPALTAGEPLLFEAWEDLGTSHDDPAVPRALPEALVEEDRKEEEELTDVGELVAD